MSCLNNYNLDVILNQLNCWCLQWRGKIATVFPSGMTQIEQIQELFTAVKNCCEAQIEVMEKFCELYKFVHDFFENLDLQEEVNNWLEQALKSGKLMTLFELFVPYVTPEMYGAKGDGVTDDTSAIQQALNTKRHVIFTKTYLISQPLNVYSDISGKGTIMYKYNTNLGRKNDIDNILTLIEQENIKISDITLNMNRNTDFTYGESEFGEWGYNIVLRACKNIIIEGIKSVNAQGDGIGIGQNNKVDSENIFVNNCMLANNYRNGISVTGCKNCVIDGCFCIDETGYCGIIIEPDANSNSETDVTVANCTVKQSNKAGFTVSAYQHGGTRIVRSSFINCNLYKTGSTTGKAQYSILFGGEVELIEIIRNYVFTNTFNNPQVINFGIAVSLWPKKVVIDGNNFVTDYVGSAPYSIYVCGHDSFIFKNNNVNNLGMFFSDTPNVILIESNYFNYDPSVNNLNASFLINCKCNYFFFNKNTVITPVQFIFDKVGKATSIDNTDNELIKNMILNENNVIFVGSSSYFCTLFRSKMFNIDLIKGVNNNGDLAKPSRQHRINTGICDIGTSLKFSIYENVSDLPSNMDDESLILVTNDNDCKFGYFTKTGNLCKFIPRSAFTEEHQV